MRKPTNKPPTKPRGAQVRVANRQNLVVDNPPSGGSEEQVAQLAYQLWQTRGCPIGSPEQDWFQAEQQLRNQESY